MRRGGHVLLIVNCNRKIKEPNEEFRVRLTSGKFKPRVKSDVDCLLVRDSFMRLLIYAYSCLDCFLKFVEQKQVMIKLMINGFYQGLMVRFFVSANLYYRFILAAGPAWSSVELASVSSHSYVMFVQFLLLVRIKTGPVLF